jgi:hypothetical protein
MSGRDRTTPDLQAVAARIWTEAAARGFRGVDPYDALNSHLLAPLLPRSRFLRLAVIQGVKRCPVDLRPLLRVPPGLNPKGIALFLQGAGESPGRPAPPEARTDLADRLLSLASRPDGAPAFGTRAARPGLAAAVAAGEVAVPEQIGWGYDFPWQAMAFLQPPYYPTVVATSFAVDALAAGGSPALPAVLEGAARFVTGTLHCARLPEGVCFSYSPRDHARVYNASLFAAKILARAATAGGPAAAERTDLARAAAAYVVARQREDGAWLYGEAEHWRWIDNLHTGFVLETLDFLGRSLNMPDWDPAVARGLAWYRANLFAPDGTPYYYPGRAWPLDAHSAAQGALTFLALAHHGADHRTFARRIIERSVAELWDERRGGFITRRSRLVTDRTIYIRWSQAWMFTAICRCLAAEKGES